MRNLTSGSVLKNVIYFSLLYRSYFIWITDLFIWYMVDLLSLAGPRGQ